MEVSGSAAAGALRVGIQILSSQRRPVLECYHELQNTYGPEQELTSSVSGRVTHRFHRVVVAFICVNIGTIRAEDVTMSNAGGLKRDHTSGFGGLFEGEIAQVAPGQVLFLFNFDLGDLYEYEDDPGQAGVKHRSGLKKENLEITADYNGPWQGLNRVMRLWCKARGRKQFRMKYTFNVRLVATDFPSPKYA